MRQHRNYRPRLFLIALALVLGLVIGCSKDKKPEGQSTAVDKAVEPDVESRPLVELQAPSPAMMYGGADSVDALVAGFQKSFTGIAPPTLNPKMVADSLQKLLKLQNASAIDLSKPARFAVFDPKKFKKGLVFTITTKGKDAFVATLPTSKKEKDGKDAYSYAGDRGKTVYVNFVNDTAVLSQEKELFAGQQEFVKQLIRAKLPKPFAFVGSVKNAVAAYGVELDKELAKIKENVKKAATQGTAGAGSQQAAQFGTMLEWIASSVKELDSVLVTATVPNDGALLAFELRPKAGSELQKTFKSLGGERFTLLEKIPSDSPFFMAFVMDPDKAGALSNKMVKWALSMGLGDVELPEKYMTAMSDYWKASTGEYIVASHKALDGKGLALTGSIGLRDAPKARDAMKIINEMYAEPKVLEAYKNLKMKVDFKRAAYKIDDVEVDTVKVSMDSAVTKDLKKLGPFADVIADMMYQHVAMKEDIGIIGYGKEGKKNLEGFLGGKVIGGLHQVPGVVRAMKNVAPGPFMLMYVQPGDVAKNISLGGKNPLADKLKDMPASSSGIALSASAKNGVVTVVMDIPAEQAKSVAQLVAQAQSL